MRQEKTFYQAFIFDMDGTVVDTIQDMAIAVNYALRTFSLPTHDIETYKHFVGNGSAMLIKRAIGPDHQDLFQPVFDCYYTYYHENFCIETKPFPGLTEALAEAKRRGVLLFIYTNKPQNIAKEVEVRCFGSGFFEKMVGIPLGGVTKPDPQAFFDAAKPYHLDYDKVAYFGDSITDLETARNLGIRDRYAVLWGYQTYEQLSSFAIKPKAFLSEPTEIMKVVDHLI